MIFIEGFRLLFGLFVFLRLDDRSFNSLDLLRSGQVTGLLAVGNDHFFRNGLRKEPDIFTFVLVVVEETELGVRIGLVAFAVADIVAQADGREETAEPGGIALFGGFDLFLGRRFDLVDLGGGSIDDQDVLDIDSTVLAGRDDRSLFDRDLIGIRVLQDHDLAVILVFEDLAFAELFDCGGCRALRLGGSSGLFRLVSRARDLR